MTKDRLICHQAVHNNCHCARPAWVRNLLCSIVVDGHFYCLISQLASSGVRDNGFCSLINIRQLGVVTKPIPGVFSRYNRADSYLGSLCMSLPRPGRCTHKSVAIHRSVCGLHSDQWETWCRELLDTVITQDQTCCEGRLMIKTLLPDTEAWCIDEAQGWFM